MAIMPGQILYYYSLGSTAATGPQSDPDASLGGTIATTPVGGNINNVLDDVPLPEAIPGRIEYRCLYVVLHPDADQVLQAPVLYITGSPGVRLALDAAVVGANSTTTIPNETTAPSGVVFVGTAVSYATGLAIGDMEPGEKKAFWQERTTIAGAPNAIKIVMPTVTGYRNA